MHVPGDICHSDVVPMNSDRGGVPPIIPLKRDDIPLRCAAAKCCLGEKFQVCWHCYIKWTICRISGLSHMHCTWESLCFFLSRCPQSFSLRGSVWAVFGQCYVGMFLLMEALLPCALSFADLRGPNEILPTFLNSWRHKIWEWEVIQKWSIVRAKSLKQLK